MLLQGSLPSLSAVVRFLKEALALEIWFLDFGGT